MAGEWIKFDTATPDKPEVVQIAARLKIDQDAVVGKLFRIWAWADDNSVDGNAVRVTSAFLDRITFCKGFANAMREAGWLTGDDGDLTFPNFDRHNGKTAKARAETNRRVAKHRQCNGKVVTPVTEKLLHNTLQKPLPEKRREEEAKERASASPVGASPPIPFAKIVETFNTTLTLLPKVRDITEARKTAIRRAWQESPARQSLPFWKALFAEYADDPFTSGKGPYLNGHENWRPDFDYLLRSKTITKTYEKAMHRMETDA